jgi:hypothetical protein
MSFPKCEIVHIWYDNTHGNYSVKSGYNTMMRVPLLWQSKRIGNDFWKKVHAPPKAKKHLLWRICKGFLLTRIRLKEGEVYTKTLTCPICDQYNEDDWHFWFECNDSMLPW